MRSEGGDGEVVEGEGGRFIRRSFIIEGLLRVGIGFRDGGRSGDGGGGEG